MKQFKNAVTVAIAAAGLYSVSAMAGTAVHWAESDAGSARDVKWQVVQPSRLDFTITPTDVQSLDGQGRVNTKRGGEKIGKAGTWSNDGDPVAVLADTTQDPYEARAGGDADGEYMVWGCRTKDDPGLVLPINGLIAWPARSRGGVYGYIYDVKQHPITDISDVKSTRFTNNITVTKYTV